MARSNDEGNEYASTGSGSTVWLEARILALTPIAAVAFRAPELLASGALGELVADALAASVTGVFLACAIAIVRAATK